MELTFRIKYKNVSIHPTEYNNIYWHYEWIILSLYFFKYMDIFKTIEIGISCYCYISLPPDTYTTASSLLPTSLIHPSQALSE